ncbi:TPR end-of-group domain-containing protein [Acinetobacter sp.]|uniref:TPR end-of-group domain-containing protein n=1 Tax=Acinetobacter sp. TaxID=472 RepID=UPI002FC6B769
MSFNVQEVAQLLKQAKENKKPYVFFTGAGCSVKADVPSATGLIQEICDKFPIQVKNIDPEKDKYNYGKYMSALDKDERRRLLKPHIIDNKKINWAHIALACLMQSGYIERVLTFNFDSILSRACNMLGLHPSIYDFATANPHLYHLISDPSIVHLHGQGTGFVQLNTADETKEHTEKLSDFIANTLNSNPSLFIGYSGNADAFFPLLEEKYSEQHRLIWTGTRGTIDELESESVKTFLNKNNNITHYVGKIFADEFLIQLAKELDCFPPELFLNPYTFLDKQLNVIQKYPLSDGLDVLSNLRGYLKEQSKTPLSESLYTAFIHKYPTKESTNDLSNEAIDDVMWAYNKQAQLLFDDQKHDDSLELYEKATNIHSNHFGCQLNFAFTLSTLAQEKQNLSLFEKALEKYQKLITLNRLQSVVYGQYALTIHKKAFLCRDQESLKKALTHFDTALHFDNNHTDNLGNYANALADYTELTKNISHLEHAIQLHENALNIEPYHLQHLNGYVAKLLSLFHSNADNTLLDKAYVAIQKTLSKNTNDTYNLACYYSLTNQSDQCRVNLLHALQCDTLPQNPYRHLSEDKDLDNVRDEQWFIELLERLKAKEEVDKVA